MVTVHKPVFQVTKSAKHEKVGKDETVGVPKDVMLHRDFRGDEAAEMVWQQDGVDSHFMAFGPKDHAI